MKFDAVVWGDTSKSEVVMVGQNLTNFFPLLQQFTLYCMATCWTVVFAVYFLIVSLMTRTWSRLC